MLIHSYFLSLSSYWAELYFFRLLVPTWYFAKKDIHIRRHKFQKKGAKIEKNLMIYNISIKSGDMVGDGVMKTGNF